MDEQLSDIDEIESLEDADVILVRYADFNAHEGDDGVVAVYSSDQLDAARSLCDSLNGESDLTSEYYLDGWNFGDTL